MTYFLYYFVDWIALKNKLRIFPFFGIFFRAVWSRALTVFELAAGSLSKSYQYCGVKNAKNQYVWIFALNCTTLKKTSDEAHRKTLLPTIAEELIEKQCLIYCYG